MMELNHIPNRAVQQLTGKQIPPIGIMTTNLALYVPSQIATATKSRADRSGANVVITMVRCSSIGPCRVAIHNLFSQYVIGLIINYPLDEEDAITVATTCGIVPVLFLDVFDLASTDNMIFSRDDGTRLGIEHLVQCGHQQIAPLSGPHTPVSARFQHASWRRHLVHYQLQPVVGLEDNWSAMPGFQQTTHMLNNGNLPTAMLITNDQIALGTIRVISGFGLRVTVNVSVIDYDGTENSACYIPPLTTTRQDFPLLGETSVDRLLQPPRGGSNVGNQLLPTALVKCKTALFLDTQTTTPRALADSLIQLAR